MLASACATGYEHLLATTLLARAGVALARGQRALALTFLEATIERAPPHAELIVQLARYHDGRLRGDAAQQSDAERSLRACGAMDIGVVTAGLGPWLDLD